MDVFQLLLDGKHCSGRGVRFRELPSSEHDQLQLDAAKQIGPEGTMLELRKIEHRMGVRRMVVGVTKQTGLKDLTGANWDKVSAADVDQNWETYFNSKDDAFLLELYRSYHEITLAEVEDLAGKVTSVSIDP